ncbi:hypothetical protein LEP1GSC061_1540 [Leptospira wolffii serovar Khorat str. Khorat-H2]|nr:hypothetical protein LEP1GSC061_1540 [Leptospira wolffii serovar Khorat str. Khorat-H2]
MPEYGSCPCISGTSSVGGQSPTENIAENWPGAEGIGFFPLYRIRSSGMKNLYATL